MQGNGVEPRQILVVRTDRIGDVVLTTPALRRLRARFPEAWIAILVSPVTTDLLKGNPDVDKVLVDDRRGRHRGLIGFCRLVTELRRFRFDLAINLHTKRRSNLLLFCSGIPRRIGYRNEKWGHLLTEPLLDQRTQGLRHEAQYCVDALRPLGVAVDGPLVPRIEVDDADRQWAAERVREWGLTPGDRIIAIHAGSSCPTKCWPLENFAELMEDVARRYQTVFVLVGEQVESGSRDPLSGLAGRLKVVDLRGQTTLGELAGLFAVVHAVISNDSGPVHIADAVGAPVVSIFTRNQPGINPERWRPLGPRSHWVAPPSDASVSFADGKVHDPAQLKKVSVRDVLAEVDAIFQV